MDALVQHFIYPLSHAGGYVFEGGRQITPDNYWASSLVGKTDEWGMSTGYRLIEPGDWVWAYFSQPIAQILGVGRVVKPVTWHARWGRYSVHIRWDRALTSALKKKPIDYAEYQQQVQGAAVRANKSTVQVLEGWLLDHGSRWVSEARAVKFAQREVLQRGLVGRPVSVPRAVNRQELKKALTEHRSRRNK